MVAFLTVLFWLSLLIILYTYLGYGILIFILSKLFRRPSKIAQTDAEYPTITHVVAAYNEETLIRDKIANSLDLDYPESKLKTLFVTDGSTDNTPAIAASIGGIQHLHSNERKGKIHAVNRVMKEIDSDVVVFSDANTFLNKEALRLIGRHYADPQVGGVAGEKRIHSKDSDNAAGAGEGLYWKYESFLKKKDAEINSIVGAAGELFSVRKHLFVEPPSSIIIEDFYISLLIASQGYRFLYEPDATATETASASVEEEWKRKVRICAGGFQAMQKLAFLLNPFRYGMLSFQYVSHRVLRWTLAPLALLLLLLSSFLLSLEGLLIYQVAFVGQVLFYTLAFIGKMLRNREIRIKGFFVPYYFSVMNLSVYAGLGRYLTGRQTVLWEKAKRAGA